MLAGTLLFVSTIKKSVVTEYTSGSKSTMPFIFQSIDGCSRNLYFVVDESIDPFMLTNSCVLQISSACIYMSVAIS